MKWDISDPTAPATFDDSHHQNETSRANQALRDYCALGCARSLEKLLAAYTANPAAPTHSLSTLKKWSLGYSWYARSSCFDRLQRQNETRLMAKRRSIIIETGLALQHERIDKLKLAYAQLEPYLANPKYLWTRCVKKVPTPDDSFEIIETFRFNADFFSQLRGLLNDIAREITRPDPAASQPVDDYPLDLSSLTDAELKQLNEIFSRAEQNHWDSLSHAS